jgi:hypothetical protein
MGQQQRLPVSNAAYVRCWADITRQPGKETVATVSDDGAVRKFHAVFPHLRFAIKPPGSETAARAATHHSRTREIFIEKPKS